jgi:hypothetical protein
MLIPRAMLSVGAADSDTLIATPLDIDLVLILPDHSMSWSNKVGLNLD